MIFAINNPIFLRPTNIINIFDHITILLIVAMAMTAVVTAGGMDLSVGISLDIGAMISISMIAVGINGRSR